MSAFLTHDPSPATGPEREVVVATPEAMGQVGSALARLLCPGDTLLLGGDLGAGKTTLTKGIAQGLGVTETVTSPTFVLVRSYPTGQGWTLLHADVWRLEQLQEVIELAIPEALEDGAVAVIEWGELAAPALSPDFLYVGIDFASPDGAGRHAQGVGQREVVEAWPSPRRLTVRALGPSWEARREMVARALGADVSAVPQHGAGRSVPGTSP